MAASDLRSPDVLRDLLFRLHADPGLWRDDPEARELLLLCREKYAALARKHGQSADDAMRLAFELLHAAGTRWAHDPWGSLTTAMRIALMTTSFEEALMCGRDQASHLMKTRTRRDVARIGEHEHLARHVENLAANPGSAGATTHEASRAYAEAERIVEDAARLLAVCGWPAQVAGHAVGLVAARLIETPDRRRAHEGLRHDRETPMVLGVSHRSWCVLVTALLGSPAATLEHTSVGHGLLRRLASGVSVDEILCDDRLVGRLIEAAPIAAANTPGSVAQREAVSTSA
ncbi:MAG: hypothetical protein FWF90_09325 [Promicromonosporaceae bacterium]|nr:hypothetical protein [Promicromonosporaceae bacterium]